MADGGEQYLITVPDTILPQHTLGQCCYIGDPLDLRESEVYISWLALEGERVKRFDVICEGLIDLHIIEFEAPATGVLTKMYKFDDDAVRAGDVLGVIERVND